MTAQHDTVQRTREEKFRWDEDNRLTALSQNGYVSHYWYDADGERTVKMHGGSMAVFVNSVRDGRMLDMQPSTAYFSPYFSIQGNSFSKHLYIGSERVASMTGTLSPGDVSNSPAGGYNISHAGYDVGVTQLSIPYATKCAAMRDSAEANYAHFDLPNALEGQTRQLREFVLPAEDSENACNSVSGNGGDGRGDASYYGNIWFIHADHLGCSTLVTDGKGNITSHHTSGQYTYGFNNGNGMSQPYAFNELMSPSPLIPQRDQHISFNAMQRPGIIREGSHVATLTYYGDMSRATMTVTDTVTHDSETRTYYDQQYNEFTKTTGNATQSKRVLWLGGSPYNAPAALVKRYGEQDWTLVHVLRDNLGSITHVVDTTGVVLQEMGYSAWGLLRDVESLDPYSPDSQPELLLGRGYTGHEHLPWFGLINMNARLYDPVVGRFLSPDPIVQAPDNTQSYNRYSYCLNNPLRYMDESGMMHYDEELGYVLEEVVVFAFPPYNPFPNFTIGWDDKPTDMRCLFNARYNLQYNSPITNGELSGCFGGVSKGNANKSSFSQHIHNIGEWAESHLSIASLHSSMLNGSLFWIDRVLLEKGAYSEGRYLPEHFPVSLLNKYFPFSIETNSTTLRNLSKFGKYAGLAGIGFSLLDAGYTFEQGHEMVASAKVGILVLETGIAYFVPFGAFVVIGFELLDSHFHWKDQLYQNYLDNTYQY